MERASRAVGSQPAASSAESIRRMWGGTAEAKKCFALAAIESVQQFGGGSSGESGVVLCGRAVCDVGVVNDSARAETSAGSQGLQGDAEKRRRCGAWNVARF